MQYNPIVCRDVFSCGQTRREKNSAGTQTKEREDSTGTVLPFPSSGHAPALFFSHDVEPTSPNPSLCQTWRDSAEI